ncbi:hypothetical protein MUK42_23289 [Musa troglodytarum]|uniref:Uncharacterized protein n=1 Tax=Musa troglodytarum TaxID=320322 RepID=A0A9E7GD06_9LILI|nr:hypothetical protein MUK42_23289 [Musa troglodytarum]
MPSRSRRRPPSTSPCAAGPRKLPSLGARRTRSRRNASIRAAWSRASS